MHIVLFQIAGRTRFARSPIGRSAIAHSKSPLLWIFFTIGLLIVLPLLDLSPAVFLVANRLLSILLIIFVAWLLISLTSVFDDLVSQQYIQKYAGDLRVRKVQTQVKVFRRLMIFIIVVIALATILMSFERVQQIGATILASAGLIGVIVGIAAQKSLAPILVGIQIAITQPIRLDDVVIVEGEWGRIEEITLTYVVVKVWDMRRLVVPVNYFVEKCFQNWTRGNPELTGTVMFYVDYTVDVQAVREKLQQILEANDKWDGKTNVLQVTDATEHTVQLRALVSAADSSLLWALRCDVREQLIQFLKDNYPGSLPRTRAEIQPPAETDHSENPTPVNQNS